MPKKSRAFPPPAPPHEVHRPPSGARFVPRVSAFFNGLRWKWPPWYWSNLWRWNINAAWDGLPLVRAQVNYEMRNPARHHDDVAVIAVTVKLPFSVWSPTIADKPLPGDPAAFWYFLSYAIYGGLAFLLYRVGHYVVRILPP